MLRRRRTATHLITCRAAIGPKTDWQLLGTQGWLAAVGYIDNGDGFRPIFCPLIVPLHCP
jgi:hypothetical protein